MYEWCFYCDDVRQFTDDKCGQCGTEWLDYLYNEREK